jgi:hypothetical protein
MNIKNGIPVNEREIENLEFRSEEVREILAALPHWTVRSGSLFLFAAIVLCLLISWIIKFPDIVKASATLTTKSPPIGVVAKNSGYVNLLVDNNQRLTANQIIGYFNTTADPSDVAFLETKLDSFKYSFYSKGSVLLNFNLKKNLVLGEIQESYNKFVMALDSYGYYIREQEYRQRVGLLNSEVRKNSVLIERLQSENEIQFDELSLSKAAFNRDSALFEQKVISKAEFEQSKKKYLSDIRSYQSSVSKITNQEIGKSQLRERISVLSLADKKQNLGLLQQTESLMNELINRLKQWKEMYLITAPTAGEISFLATLIDKKFIKSGDEIAFILPQDSEFLVKAKVPVAGSGKIKIGQIANVKLDNYPFSEYGMLSGKIMSMSTVPREDHYDIDIELPTDLTTSFGRKIEFKLQTGAQVEIITKDMRLIERLFYNLRRKSH